MPRLHHDGTPWMTCDHDCHRRRGSLGGEDWALRVGEPIRAPFDGTFRYHGAGTGGYTFTGIPADARLRGIVTQAMHNSRANGLVLGGRAKYVREGHVLGWSGGAIGHPGSGSSTGPHTHQHGILNGVRVAMTAAVQWMRARVGASLAGSPSSTDKEIDVRLIRRDEGSPEWSLFHPSLRGPDSKQRGYIVTTSLAVARGWARTWGDGLGNEKGERRDVYVEMQAAARITYDAAQRAQAPAPAPSAPAVVGGTITMTGTITPKE